MKMAETATKRDMARGQFPNSRHPSVPATTIKKQSVALGWPTFVPFTPCAGAFVLALKIDNLGSSIPSVVVSQVDATKSALAEQFVCQHEVIFRYLQLI